MYFPHRDKKITQKYIYPYVDRYFEFKDYLIRDDKYWYFLMFTEICIE